MTTLLGETDFGAGAFAARDEGLSVFDPSLWEFRSGSGIVPVNIRTFASTLFGSRADITAADFSEEDRQAILRAVARVREKTGKTEGVIGYGDYGEKPGDFSSFGLGQSLGAIVTDSFSDPKMRLETTLGMARFKAEEDGTVVITDRYRFDANRDDLKKRPSFAEAFRTAGWEGVLNLMGNSFGPTQDEPGRKIELRLGKPIADAEGRRKANARLFDAADRLQRFVENSDAEGAALDAAYERRNASILAATGEKLPNPFREAVEPSDFRPDAFRESNIPEIVGTRAPGNDPLRKVLDGRIADWNARLAALAAKHPDKLLDIKPEIPIEAEARAIAGVNAQNFSAASSDPRLSVMSRNVMGFSGGVFGSFRDPLQVATAFVGGGGGYGKNVLTRIGSAFMADAAVNAGVQAALEVKGNQWREELGLGRTKEEQLRAIGIAALFGGVVGSGQQGARELAGLGRLPEQAKVFSRGAAAAEETETAARGTPPPGVTPEEANVAEAQAVRQAEQPLYEPPPDIVPLKPARDEPTDLVTDEQKPGAATTIGGKPVMFRSFDAATLGTDARTFQYKAGGDQAGVTERLKAVRKFDPTASGKVFVFEKAGGDRIVADGHQRLGLARRLIDDGHEKRVDLEGYLFREADGWTPEEVRALSARKNLQEGSGTAIDAARIMRDHPEILDDGLPTTGPMMRSAIGLSKLSDQAWGMTVNGVVPENFAAAVGQLAPDPATHGAIMADLAKFAPETEREARLLIADAMSVGMRADEQIDLFGKSEASRTLMGERVKILDEALATLRKDKKLFSAITQNAELVAEVGNVLNREGNVERQVTADTLGEIIGRLAQRTGPVSDYLNRAAVALAEGGTKKAATAAFLADVKRVLDEEGLGSLLYRPQPKLAPDRVVEPGTPEALAAAEGNSIPTSERSPENLEPDSTPLDPGRNEVAPDLFDLLPAGSDETGAARFADKAALLEDASRRDLLADIAKGCPFDA